MLMDDTGNIKPFSKFWQETESIYSQYNKLHLQAEYIFATQSAQMALKWNEYEADGDRYNLQYRTAADDRVRDSHAALHNTTLPPSDQFWKDYFPPNGWRCRCTAVQVRKSKYTESESTEAQNAGALATDGKNNIFRFNPGKEQVIFPKHHPYFPKACATCSRYSRLAMRDADDFCKFCQKAIVKTPEDPKEERKELREWAAKNIVGSEVEKEGLTIKFTGGGIKEYLNQPHKYYYEKNELIKDIHNALLNSIYRGVSRHKGRISHIFEIEIQGEKSWLIANEHKGMGVCFYSVSDSDKVLKEIEKPA